MFAKNGTLLLQKKKSLNKGMCNFNFASMEGQGFYGLAEHPYQNIMSIFFLCDPLGAHQVAVFMYI